MDFMALVIISQFGNFFYQAANETEFKDIITQRDFQNFLTVQTTTSTVGAHYEIEGNKIELQQCEKEWREHAEKNKGKEDEITALAAQIPTYIRVDFRSRTRCNKLLYLLYKLFRIFYVTFWFYFMPFSVIFFSYMFEGDARSRQ